AAKMPGGGGGATPEIALALARSGARDAAARRLHWVAQANASQADAYTSALNALLAMELGERGVAAPWLKRLRATAGAAGWRFDGETPFHGWGRPGQLETSALAVQALVKANDPADSDLIARSLGFLLSQKDAFGVWYSGHTTAEVLDAIIAA